MTIGNHLRRGHALGWLGLAAVLGAVACSNNDAAKPAEPSGPFKSMTVSANDSSKFIAPQAGVPLADGAVAFLASDATTLEQGVFVARDGEITVLHVGGIVSGFDIDVTLDGSSLIVADRAAGERGLGALLGISLESGELTTLGALDYGPASVTVAREGADAGHVYFSGRDPEAGEPGVFRMDAAGTVEAVHLGAPLVEPSGIALLDDGRVIVGETSLNGGTEAALVLLAEGEASLIAQGLRSGYPFGIALNPEQSAIVVSAVDPNSWNDSVYAVPVAGGAAVKITEFEEEMSSAGLKEGATEGTYAWASLSQKGGTVYTVVAN